MKKIVLIEDDPFLVRFYKTKLAKLNYEVTFVESGTDALGAVTSTSPDLVITDLALKDKDGFEVIKQLREDEATKTIPIFVLTNLGMEEDIAEIKKFDVEKYIVKSNTDIGTVLNDIQEYLGE